MIPARSRRPSPRAAVVAAAALAVLAGCGSVDDSSPATTSVTVNQTGTTAAAGVTVADAWARTSPAMATRGAIYLNLTSAAADRLVKVEVPASVAGRAEIHETVATGTPPGPLTAPTGETGSSAMATTTTAGSTGSMTTAAGSTEMEMRPVVAIELPAGETVALKPGGFHVMLMDLAAPLTVGSSIDLTLTFEKAGPQTIPVPVKQG